MNSTQFLKTDKNYYYNLFNGAKNSEAYEIVEFIDENESLDYNELNKAIYNKFGNSIDRLEKIRFAKQMKSITLLVKIFLYSLLISALAILFYLLTIADII